MAGYWLERAFYRGVRRLIRNIKTREFFRGGVWISDPAAAQDFPDTLELLTTCDFYQLTGVEVIVQTGLESPGADEIRIPLPVVFDEMLTSEAQPAPS